jgi:hypothetical protein
VERVRPVAFMGTVLIATLVVGQVGPPKHVERLSTIGRLCGLLVERHLGLDGFTKLKLLRNVVLRVYERSALTCCDGIQAIAEAKTGNGARFKFRRLKPGEYWLVTTASTQEYKLPIRVESTVEPSGRCSNQIFEIDDSGNFQIKTMPTLNIGSLEDNAQTH